MKPLKGVRGKGTGASGARTGSSTGKRSKKSGVQTLGVSWRSEGALLPKPFAVWADWLCMPAGMLHGPRLKCSRDVFRVTSDALLKSCACTANTISQICQPACDMQQSETNHGSTDTVTRQVRHSVPAEPVAQHRDSNQVELQHAGFQKLLQKGGVWEMVKVHALQEGNDANNFFTTRIVCKHFPYRVTVSVCANVERRGGGSFSRNVPP